MGGRLSPAEPDAGATASAKDMKRLIPKVRPTTELRRIDTSKKKKKEKKKEKRQEAQHLLICYTSRFIRYNKQQYEMGIKLVLRIIFAVVWSSQLTSGSLLPFELPHCLHNQSDMASTWFAGRLRCAEIFLFVQ